MRRGSRLRWTRYVLASVFAVYSHYVAAFILVAQGALAILVFRHRLIPWLAAQAAIGLLFVPWFLLAGNLLSGYQTDFFPRASLSEILLRALEGPLPRLVEGLRRDGSDGSALRLVEKGYRVLVLAGCPALSDRQVGQISAFVGKGGRVCLIGPAGTHDEWMRPRPKAAFGDLAAAGVKILGTSVDSIDLAEDRALFRKAMEMIR